MTTTFYPLKLGGGGYITAVRISSDGNTRMIRTDTFGAYCWNSGTGYWDCTNVIGRMPTADINIDAGGYGCYEIAIAPSNSSTVYIYSYYVHKSVNGGLTFTRTNFSGLWSDPNAQNGTRFIGPKMAVHPTDPNTVYMMTQSNGLWYTRDGGTSWTNETTVPTSSNNNAGTVTFDLTGANIFVTCSGHGLYKGTPSGAFSAVSGGPGSSAIYMHIKMATNGTLFLSINNFQATPALWRYVPSTTTWTSMAIPGGGQSVVCDPNNVDRVLYGNSGGGWSTSLNANVTTPSWSAFSGTPTRVSGTGEPAWLSYCNEYFMSEGDAQFDPTVTNRLWIAEGVGVWYADVGASTVAATTCNSQNKGIEGMVATQLRSAPNGVLIASQWDRGIVKFDPSNPNTYTSRQIIDLGDSINHGWFVDWCPADSTFWVTNMSNPHGTIGPGYSTDSGEHWTIFPKSPEDFGGFNAVGVYGGSIVAATSQKILWQPQWDNDLWYSGNQGTTWTKQNLSSFGVPLNNATSQGSIGTNETGWGHASAFGGVRHKSICADRATSGIFYAYNCGSNASTSFAGVYKLDATGTPTWTRQSTGSLTAYTYDAWNIYIDAVPKLTSVDTTGHLFYTPGQAGGTNPSSGSLFRYSRDGGVTWTTITNMLEVYTFGFGKEGVGKDYPTVFAAGWYYNGSVWTWGYYKSEANNSDWAANTATWTSLTDYPYGWTDWPNTIDGDKLIRGRFYIGFSGSSYAYGDDGSGGGGGGGVGPTGTFGFSVVQDSSKRQVKMIGY